MICRVVLNTKLILFLDRVNAEVRATREAPGIDGLTMLEYSERTYSEGNTVNLVGGNLLLAQAHGHNLTQDPRKVNLPGTSDIDVNTAKSAKITIYSIDAYNTRLESKQRLIELLLMEFRLIMLEERKEDLDKELLIWD